MSRLAERNQLFSVCKYGVSFLSIAVFGHKLLLLLPIPYFLGYDLVFSLSVFYRMRWAFDIQS